MAGRAYSLCLGGSAVLRQAKGGPEDFDDVFYLGDASSYYLVDSLKPAVTASFLHEVREFLDEYGLDVADHNSRWGGAVHFVLASRSEDETSVNKEGNFHVPL